MNEALLEAIEISPAGAVLASIIWLHGLGADGHDFEPLIPELGVVEQLGVRVVLPHAPRMPVTINGGMVMPAWYDIAGVDFRQAEDARGIRTSSRRLAALIEREIARGIPPERIVLAGFSQGGAIALHTGLRYPERLAGILALSTYLPLAQDLPDERAAANAGIPIMQAHGEQDTVVPLALAVASRDRLQALGYRVDWHTYHMPHAVSPAEIEDIRDWLYGVLQD
jgi:phospholipase/carboxylesterase